MILVNANLKFIKSNVVFPINQSPVLRISLIEIKRKEGIGVIGVNKLNELDVFILENGQSQYKK